jgi:hypothetical protein
VDQESSQVGVAAFGDGAEAWLQSAGVLAGNESEVAGEPTSGREAGRVADEADQRRGSQKADAGNAHELGHGGSPLARVLSLRWTPPIRFSSSRISLAAHRRDS